MYAIYGNIFTINKNPSLLASISTHENIWIPHGIVIKMISGTFHAPAAAAFSTHFCTVVCRSGSSAANSRTATRGGTAVRPWQPDRTPGQKKVGKSCKKSMEMEVL